MAELANSRNHQTPIPKHQRSTKSQAPNRPVAVFEVWCLGFLWGLVIGVLGLRAFPRSKRVTYVIPGCYVHRRGSKKSRMGPSEDPRRYFSHPRRRSEDLRRPSEGPLRGFSGPNRCSEGPRRPVLGRHRCSEGPRRCSGRLHRCFSGRLGFFSGRRRPGEGGRRCFLPRLRIYPGKVGDALPGVAANRQRLSNFSTVGAASL